MSNTAALFGGLLSIHPPIEMLDGKLIPTKKLRGKLSALVPALVRDYARNNDLEREELWLIRSPRLPESVVASAEETARALGFQKVT